MISPKVIDVEGNRIETTDKYMISVNEHKTIFMNYENNKVIGRREMDNGRFPTQLFTNINEDKYKYIKII